MGAGWGVRRRACVPCTGILIVINIYLKSYFLINVVTADVHKLVGLLV